MKKLFLPLILIVFTLTGYGQITIESGGSLIVSSSTSVIAANGIVNNGGQIDIAGTAVVENRGDLENNISGLITTTSTGTFKFNGASAQEITGNHDAEFYGIVEIDNSNGVSITNTITGSDQTISGTLIFTDGLLTLNTFDLTLANDATTPGAARYVQTNSTGVVIRSVPADGATDIVYPVGNSAYNPITLQNSGMATTDDYSVRVINAEPAGSSTDHFVDRSWEVTEGTAGGSELTVTAQWNSGEELTDFDRDNAAIGLTTDAGSTYEWGETGPSTGSDPYTMQGNTFTGTGTFTVGDYFYSGKRLDLKLFLAGAYDTISSNMDKTLNTGGLIPTTDPYGMNTTAPSIPTDAVDWVKVVLRDKTTPTTLIDSFAFFVDINGNLLDTLGNTGGKIYGVVLDQYNVEVIHRNHLGIMTSSTVDLNIAGTPSYDFTIALTQAWDDATVTTNDAMKEVGTGVWGLWEGDANGDGNVKYNGSANDKNTVLSVVGLSTPNNIVSAYSTSDINMNGEVKYNGSGNDKNKILSVVGLSTPNTIFTQHLPN